MALEFLAVLAFLQPPQPVSLKLDMKPGDQFTVQMVRAFSDPEDEFDLSISEKLAIRVSAVDGDQLTFLITRSQLEQKMDGKPLPQDPKMQPVILSDIRKRNGELTSTKPVMTDAETEARLWRAAVVSFPEKPARVGDVWSYDWPDLGSLKLPSAQSQFRFIELDIVKGIALIWVDFQEKSTSDPMRASGRALIDLKTGWPMEEHLTFRNARIPGGDGKPIKLELTLTMSK